MNVFQTSSFQTNFLQGIFLGPIEISSRSNLHNAVSRTSPSTPFSRAFGVRGLLLTVLVCLEGLLFTRRGFPLSVFGALSAAGESPPLEK